MFIVCQIVFVGYKIYQEINRKRFLRLGSLLGFNGDKNRYIINYKIELYVKKW